MDLFFQIVGMLVCFYFLFTLLLVSLLNLKERVVDVRSIVLFWQRLILWMKRESP